MDGISILVTAWNNTEYIEECLDSISKQIFYNDKFEVLLGIDGCKKTKEKFLEIKEKYNSIDLKAFYMKSNKGTYITTNTLAQIAKFKILLRFDSDDIMKENMLSKIYYTFKENTDLVMFRCNNFKGSKFSLSAPLEGVMAYTKDAFEKVGGYKPWRCAADTDFLRRLRHLRVNREIINEALYDRRIHSDSLTQRGETRHGSPLRMKYVKELAKSFQKIKTVVNDYEEL